MTETIMDYADPYAERPRYSKQRASNMTIAITGHTAGIGQALAAALVHRGDSVIGLSRSNGYDIVSPAGIVAAARDADVFVCNAHSAFAQVELVYEMARVWAQSARRLIIVMSSLSADGIIPSQGRYAIFKKALDAGCEQLQADPNIRCRITLLRFGYTNTARIATKSVRKMKVGDVVGHALYAIDQPQGHYLKRLDFRVHNEVQP